MSHLRVITAQLQTAPGRHAGTNDQIYVGVYGTGGGREFPLGVSDKDDFEPDESPIYLIGDPSNVPFAEAVVGYSLGYVSDRSQGGANDPVVGQEIEFSEITHVYIRKSTGGGPADDDGWKSEGVEVKLWGSAASQFRVFRTTSEVWLGHEFGLQIWLAEATD